MQRLNDISQLHDEMMKDPKYRRQYEADQQSKAYEEQQQHLRDIAKLVDTIGYDRLRELVEAWEGGRAVINVVNCAKCEYWKNGYCSYHSDVRGKVEPMRMDEVDYCSRGKRHAEAEAKGEQS